MAALAVLAGSAAAEGPQANAGPAVRQDQCAFPAASIPDDTIVIAAGSYEGRELPFQIDQTGHSANQFDVAVHADKPVALLLGAYEPSIWNISWSKGTRIVAVFASGHHRQEVAGLPAGTPVITSTSHGRGPCGSRYIGGESGLEWVNPMARRVFGRAATRVYAKAPGGRIGIVESARPAATYESSPDRPPESFRDRGAPLAGSPGLDQAVTRGLIRPANPQDIEAVRQHYRAMAARRGSGVVDVPPVAGSAADAPAQVRIPRLSTFRGYVVLKPFVFPAGLFGAHAANFIVPQGVAAPSGNPGHSLVVDLNKPVPCSGPLCDA